MLLNYNYDGFSEGYCEIKEAFRAPKKYDILKPYIFDHIFRSSNEVIDIG